MLITGLSEKRGARLVAALVAALLISLTLWLCLMGTALAATDYDGDGAIDNDCRPLDPAVHPGATDYPDLTFEDLNCDGIDGDKANAYFVQPSGSDGLAGEAGAVDSCHGFDGTDYLLEPHGCETVTGVP